MKLETLIINVIIFLSLIGAFAVFSNSFFGYYMPDNVSSDQSMKIINMSKNSTIAISEWSKDATENLQGQVDIIKIALTVPALIWGVIMMAFEIPTILIGVINIAAEILNIPGWFITMIIAILMVYIVFKVISMIRGTET